jgi:zinc protease
MTPVMGRRSAPRRGLFAATALLGLASFAFCGTAAAKVFDPTSFTLANGLQVVVIENHRAPVVSHMVWYKIGAADEVPGKSGIAHFLEHLMFKGTEEVPPGQFSKIIAANGGRDNAFTSWDYTGYFQNIARDRLELAMKLEADRMANLVLTDAEVDPERQVILEERRSRIDNRPQALLGEQMNAALFMNHPYGRPIIGWAHEMAGLTTEDAIAWHRHYYAPNNAVLIVAGDITADELKPLAEKYYGVVAARDVPERQRVVEPTQHAPRRVVLKSPRVQQPAWRRKYLAPSYTRGDTEHAYALQVLAEIIGSGSTSRLYRGLVVDGGIAVSAGAWYDADTLDLATFDFWVSPKPGGESEAAVAAVEEAIDAEIARVVAHGIEPEELARAKRRMQAAAVYARDGLQTGARVLGTALATGQTIADVEAWPDRIDAVTAAQVQAAAKAVFVPARSVTGVLLPEPTS